MSNVYILPRNFAATAEIPVSSLQGQRPIRMTKTGTVGGRVLNDRRAVRLQRMPSRNTNSIRRVYVVPPQGQNQTRRTHYQLQPIAPATANSDYISLEQFPTSLDSENVLNSSFASQEQIFMQNIQNQQLSEEDNELNIGEVYKLLDESAGQRINDDLVNLPKRRERLTNLTMEQKMLRRKQKNRIAAQAARDRKKETNKKLEETLKRALQEINRLRGELKFLQAQNSQLLAIQNGKNAVGNIQPHQNIFQNKPFKFPKQEILMSTADQQMQNKYDQYESCQAEPAVRNFSQEQLVMKQTYPCDLKSNILSSSNASNYHQPIVNNTCLINQSSSPSLQPNNPLPLQNGSLGSAASFNDLLPWERESLPEVRVKKETEKVMDRIQSKKIGKDKMPVKTIGRQQQNLIRMTCMIKVFTALWSIVCEKRETVKTPKNCKTSSTNFLKKWTFQSMWTASATKSLKKALLRRMLLMDNAKLLRLCKSPRRQLVANLLMRSTNLKTKFRLRQESIRKNLTLTQTNSNNNIFMNNNYSHLKEEEMMNSNTEESSTEEEDCQIVPHLH